MSHSTQPEITGSERPVTATAPATALGFLLVIALLALNLRPIVTAGGPLLQQIHASTGLSLQNGSLLTVLPMLCMGVIPLLMPLIGRLFSESSWIRLGLAAIAAGCLWRFVLTDSSALLLSTVLAGVGVALVQTLTPGIAKRWYPGKVALAMGIYSGALMAGGGLAAILSPAVAQQSNSWQTGLGIWCLPAALALIVWQFSSNKAPQAAAAQNSQPGRRFANLPRAWLLAAYFGFANGGYATMVAWLPSYAQSLGWSVSASGQLVALMTVFQVVTTISAPILSGSLSDRRPWLLAAVLLQITGFCGMLLAAQWLGVWVAMIGVGLGACFSLTLTLTLDHLSDPRQAGALTAFVQGVGFIITAAIPYIAGSLYQLAGFSASWLLILATLSFMLLATLRFAPRGYTKAVA